MIVEALVFDVFGTVVDWEGTVSKELQRKGKGVRLETADWLSFAREWRKGYMEATRCVADGGEGSLNVDTMHREILDAMLSSPKWLLLADFWGEEDRQDLNNIWHRLDGWPDSTEGLYALKKLIIIGTLSNGNVRLLVDMAKHSNLPWDVIFSGELIGSYKPNPKMYLGAAHHLSVSPSKCALVAAHIEDLRAAAKVGMRTVYIRRPTEDTADVRNSTRSKSDGGEVDLVVDSLVELAEILARGTQNL